MTERKPADVSHEDWVEHQIRQAERRGEFAELPGRGKPLPGNETEYDALWWVKAKMRREGLGQERADASASLVAVCRRDAEELPAVLARVEDEAEVRRRVAELNRRITDLHLMPPPGPPLGIPRFKVGEVVREWRLAREAAARGRPRAAGRD
ncbi:MULTISPECIES: DnaJ family domain-containing protein [Streptomyces]|uniref:DnaJ-like, subfamily C, domain-containing protein n=2 Tax=Streptomyces TaxID=1883 RepID=A0A380MLZ9_STRGR|nr:MULTISPECIES: DUF1992 domain-containing protein [Streptomyces]NEE40220.1 DUF1992 domain-containing protein [Streptomyces sp. SID7982]NEE58248.1 DUF1992 domain-containing protein [Streptomyces sp. SID8455]MBL3805440.1 DUF1992 domain-containing protein [Streptomyces sp. BRB081]MDQ0294238.1 hypothetical protein [Streptomyces sp. DSM 41037]NEC15492.1 DUF1992 domain-containing protein [Streptomyces sp. SID8014]